jgi:type II secretory pathway component PulK
VKLLAALLFLLVVAVVLYYARLHLEWRAEVRRRRLEREREREQNGYRMYEPL